MSVPAASVAGVQVQLSRDEARRAALRTQGLLGAPDHRGGTGALLRRLGAVQLDTISVLARSHELVSYARLGAVGRSAVEAAYWGRGTSFEYWSHAGCLLPLESWPTFAFRRRAFARRGWRWHAVPKVGSAEILARLRGEGPLTATELGGAKRGGPWWDWSDTKITVEWLVDIGAVIVTERRGWRRVYDLPERALPADVLGVDLTDPQCLAALVEDSGRCLGVADEGDLADYHRLTRAQVRSVLGQTSLVPVGVQGWAAAGWAHPDALAQLSRGGRHRTTLLSPFDSLVWDRRRTERVFGFIHRLEAYVPRAKRVHGYFAMPLLAGGALLGRVDPRRAGSTLVAAYAHLASARALAPMATALREAATWVGCDAVAVERVTPDSLRGPLLATLK